MVVLHKKLHDAILQPADEEDQSAPDAHFHACTVDGSASLASSFVPYCSYYAAVDDAHVDAGENSAAKGELGEDEVDDFFVSFVPIRPDT